MVEHAAPMDRLLGLESTKTLTPRLPGLTLTLLLLLLVLGNMTMLVVEARTWFRDLAMGTCRIWRMLFLHPTEVYMLLLGVGAFPVWTVTRMLPMLLSLAAPLDRMPMS